MFNRLCVVHKVAAVLVIVGAINWGLIGLLQYNLVGMIFGSVPMLLRLVYVLVGLSGVAMLFTGSCKMCTMEGGMKKK